MRPEAVDERRADRRGRGEDPGRVGQPVVVLDEPTSGQDRATWQAVVDRLGALADSGTAIVAVTHDRDLVRALDADEVVLSPTGATRAHDETGAPGATTGGAW